MSDPEVLEWTVESKSENDVDDRARGMSPKRYEWIYV